MPATILKFRGNGDEATAKLLEDIIYKVLPAITSLPSRPVLLALVQQMLHANTWAAPAQLPDSSCLKCGVLQEEITHCAAGVRWLRYLHTLAHGLAGADIDQSAVKPEAGSSIADASGGATTSTADAPWMEEARQFPKVEQWFHSLVKRYFKGNLKVGPYPRTFIAAYGIHGKLLQLHMCESQYLPLGWQGTCLSVQELALRPACHGVFDMIVLCSRHSMRLREQRLDLAPSGTCPLPLQRPTEHSRLRLVHHSHRHQYQQQHPRHSLLRGHRTSPDMRMQARCMALQTSEV